MRTGYDVAAEVTRAALAPYAARPGWSGLTAIRNGEVHAIEHGLCRTLFDDTAMLYIAKRLYPDAFEDDATRWPRWPSTTRASCRCPSPAPGCCRGGPMSAG